MSITIGPNYADPDYWRARYQNDDPQSIFDWYCPYVGEFAALLQGLALPHPKNCSTLVVGCGNSRMAEEMYDDGFTDILNIDISEDVLQRMQKRAQRREGLRYQYVDARSMPFDDDSFHLVIDKGTLDALAHGDAKGCADIVKETHRVLSAAGFFVMISHSTPTYRSDMLNIKALGWKTEVITMQNTDATGRAHNAYLLQKPPRT